MILNIRLIKDLMIGRRFRHMSRMSLLSLLVLLIAGCTDDLGYKPEVPDEDFTGITLYLPDIEGAAEFGATRTEDTVDEKTIEIGTGEATINSMYLFVFNSEGDKVSGFENPINLTDIEPTNAGNNYKAYPIPIKEGTYKLYLLANLNEYLGERGVVGLSNEADILNAVLNFKDKVPGTLTLGNLPMACLASQMKDADKNPAETIKVVAGKNNAVYADMQFLCAKVRYTILFDKEESGNTFSGNDVDFTSASASYVKRETALVNNIEGFTEPEFIPDGISGLELYKAEYPNDASGYFSSSREEAPLNLSEHKEEWTESDKQRAWQGTVYLPENLSLEKAKRTIISFAGTGSELNETNELVLFNQEDQKLERSNFYDIVIRLRTAKPQLEDYTVVVDPWNVQTLTYQLHGTYWLEVESPEIAEVKSGAWSDPFGFDLNDEISIETFESPKIKGDFSDELVNFFEIKEIKPGDKDDNGNLYELDPKWPHYLRLTVNPEIPYTVLKQIDSSAGYTYEGEKVESKDLEYIHIKSGNIHKRIDIKNLSLKPYLTVDPLTVIIDAREYYTQGKPEADIYINFHASFDNNEEGVSFTLTDSNNLFSGKGNGALVLSKDFVCEKKEGATNVFNISDQTGNLILNIKDLTGGNTYWSSDHEYTLTFTMKAGNITVTRKVTIIVKKFSTNYTIYFRDNTKSWKQPHIYVYQLLTLPTDLPKYPKSDERYDERELHPFAGKLVGYVEDNQSSNMQWNGVPRYVFTNNLSFKGWKDYGGPDINDPWQFPVSCGNDTWKDGYAYERNTNETMGFVMLGDIDFNCAGHGGNGTKVTGHYQWNFDYGYTEQAGNNKFLRYNYDVNLNQDHEAGIDKDICEFCWKSVHEYGSDFNYETDLTGNNDDEGRHYEHTRFYPGVVMESAEDEKGEGWWKYTLTGIAEPGRTVMFFSNLHLPWEALGKNFGTEDNRFPGEYEAGIPLFDFPDNEGYLLFNGNSNDRDQHFEPILPEDKIIPNKFNSEMARNLILEVKIPLNSNNDLISKIEVGHYEEKRMRNTGFKNIKDRFRYVWDFKPSDNIYRSYNSSNWSIVNEKLTLSLGDLSSMKDDGEDPQFIYVKVTLNNGKIKEYQVPPKFFKEKEGKYVTREPLYIEYSETIKLNVKWSDNITIVSGWNEEYSYYNKAVESGGASGLTIYEGKGLNGYSQRKSWNVKNEIIGNYKHLIFDVSGPFDSVNDKDILTLKLNTTEGDYYKYLSVEELPKYYNPAGSYYLINWHLLKRPEWYEDGNSQNWHPSWDDKKAQYD